MSHACIGRTDSGSSTHNASALPGSSEGAPVERGPRRLRASQAASMHAHEPSRPITRADARRLGIPTRQLAGPSFQRVFHNQYLPAEIKVGTFQRPPASLRIPPAGSYVSHHTAATLWGACAPVAALGTPRNESGTGTPEWWDEEVLVRCRTRRCGR